MKKLVLAAFLMGSFAVADESDQRTLLAYLRVKPGGQAQFLEAAKNVIKESRKEPGNLIYILQKSVSDPQLFVFYELFRTDADLEFHRRTKHVVDFLEEVRPILLPDQFTLMKYDTIR